MKSSVSIGGIGMYGGKYCGTSQYALTWYVLWYVLLCIVFSEYWKVMYCTYLYIFVGIKLYRHVICLHLIVFACIVKHRRVLYHMNWYVMAYLVLY